MIDPWTFEGQPTPRGTAGGSVTLVEGAAFCISDVGGNIEPGSAEGLFFEDTRFVSTWRLSIDRARLQSLALISRSPFAATFLSRGQARPGESDSTILLERSRSVDNGMREELIVRNMGREAATCTVGFELDADFAHLFEVKENRVQPRGTRLVDVAGSLMRLSYEHGDVTRSVEVDFPPSAEVRPNLAVVDIVLAPGGEWRTVLQFRLAIDSEPVGLAAAMPGVAARLTPAARLRAWERAAPTVRTAHAGLDATFVQSERDLGALRIFDPEHPDRAVLAAGAPWFMTLFGRDSIIASLMALDVDPSLAASTLLTLGRLQGERVNDSTEEQPGKILHEIRRGLTTPGEAKTGSVYYGSIDSTPLFVVLLGALHRWGIDREALEQLLPHADRALDWIDRFGDRDGDGFVEYERATPQGLLNQGWKDSFDGVSFAEGALAAAPVALCEVQGYVYSALVARAEIARSLGDITRAKALQARASRLKIAFNTRFWLEDRGYYAIALDGDKRPVDAMSSNMGHCLWSGIVDKDKASRVAEHLCSDEMFTGWGIRTLARSMARYNPVSYHNGSVWPHDTAICAAGLSRYGFTGKAKAVTVGLLEAAEAFGGRLPELFCGFDRGSFPIPVPYPASCSPQAWASASPFFLLKAVLLGLEPSVHDRQIACAPSIPDQYGTIVVENLLLSGTRVSISATGTEAKVDGLPLDFRVMRELSPSDA